LLLLASQIGMDTLTESLYVMNCRRLGVVFNLAPAHMLLMHDRRVTE
jgi:hypothetical protein